MSAPFYTTRDLQAMLQVDRTTIYRMAESARLPGMKVGNQWRYPRRLIDQWLEAQTNGAQPVDESGLSSYPPAAVADGAATRAAVPSLAEILPLECVQLMLDAFADALGIMVVLTDLQGHPITRTSNPCGLLAAVEAHPEGYARCLALWAEIAARPALLPTFTQSDLGLMCTRAFVRVNHELIGMVVFGGIAPREWPPTPLQLEASATALHMDVADLNTHVTQVYTMDAAQEQRLLTSVQRVADVITHIVSERREFSARLTSIAALANPQAAALVLPI